VPQAVGSGACARHRHETRNEWDCALDHRAPSDVE
jgi:hypothetical protein